LAGKNHHRTAAITTVLKLKRGLHDYSTLVQTAPSHTGSTAIPPSSARDDDDNDDNDDNDDDDVTGYGPIGSGDGKNGKYDE
jgi:hypothetical protein